MPTTTTVKLRPASAGLLLACAVALAVTTQVLGTCENGGCPEQHAAATNSGLLGSVQAASCSGKTQTYPKTGKLKPVRTDTPVVDFKWAGSPHEFDKHVFAVTQPVDDAVGGRLWYSNNYGKEGSWEDATLRMEGAMDEVPNMESMKGVVDIFMHEDHAEKVFFQGAGYKHWITEDFGRTFISVATPGGSLGWWGEIKIHPNRPDWILSKAQRAECNRADSATSKWCAYDLFVSRDFGKSWLNLTESSKGAIASFWDFDWGARLHRGKHNSYPDETIFATAYESADHMKGPYPGWDKDIHFVMSHDFFSSAHTRLASCGNQFELVGHMMYLAMPSDCPVEPDGRQRSLPSGSPEGSNVVLYISEDEGRSFTQTCLPVKWMDLGYNLLRTHDSEAAFLIVDHDEEDMVTAKAPVSNVYAPGFNSSLFTLSLPRNYRQHFVTDFARVEGLPGVFMANQLSGERLHDPAFLKDLDYDRYVQTKVTFNGGAHWQQLQTPEVFRHAICDRCRTKDEKNCQLHLHGPSSWHEGPDGRPSFYSHDNVPGVIMAVGNTGQYLDRAADAMCTWLSRDGGASWEDVMPGAAIYEFGDHGGLLLMAPHEIEAPATAVHFSMDEGACWHTIELEEAIDVQNIRVEPKATSHMFVVHGKACQKSDQYPTCGLEGQESIPPGRMYIIDIKDLMGSDWKDCQAGDYEVWSPPRPDICLLGKNVTVERRKRESLCFNGKEYERAEAHQHHCLCDQADVECEYGYEWLDGECRLIMGLDRQQCGVITGGLYVESVTHRRLVHGDMCDNVSRIIMDTDGKGHYNVPDVPRALRHSILAAVFGSVVAVTILVTGVAVWWLSFASDEQRESIEDTLAPVAIAVRGISDSLGERLFGRRRRGSVEEAFFQPLAGGEDFGLDDLETPSATRL